MKGVSFVQQGVVACREFIKLLMIGSKGQLEASLPATDDERRDLEVHLKGRFAGSLSFQVKSARRLVHPNGMDLLSIAFSVKKARVRTSPRFWYFFGWLDFNEMAFKDPVFLVPSAYMHRVGARGATRGFVHFRFGANMKAGSKDVWQRYRLTPAGVGERVLEILKDARLEGTAHR